MSSADSHRRRSASLSLALHFAAIAFLLLIGNSTQHRDSPSLLKVKFVPLASPVGRAGRGGGGQRSPTPPSKGPLPRLARLQITPPLIRTTATPPKLVVPPTLVVSADLRLPTPPLLIGDPDGVPGPPSGGPGTGGGIGNSSGSGVGDNHGPGYGDGDNDGFGSVHDARIIRPVLLYKTDPDYSEEARKARYQGAVLLRIDIGPDGRPANVHVERPLGLGLDEKAMEAVRQWKFRPAMRNGKPVPVSALVEVHFRLL